MSDFTIDDAVAQSLQGTATALRDSMAQALPTNPDAEAQTRRYAAAAQVPLDTARDAPGQVKVQAQMAVLDTQTLQAKAPHLAQWLTNPDNAKIAHDDIPTTSSVEQHVKALGALPGWHGETMVAAPPPSYRERLNAWMRDLVGLPPPGRDEAAAARAFLDVTAQRMGTDRQGLRDAVGGMSPIPQQFASNFTNSFTAGVAPNTAGAADTTGGQIAAGAGQLAGFITGAPLKVGEYAVGKTVGNVLERTAGESFVKALGKDMGRQAATLGIASGVAATGKALDTSTPGGAVDAVMTDAKSGAAMGAVFGAAGRLFPDNTAAQFIARALGVNATLDAMQGSRPWDDRPVAQKVFDYGLNTVFAANGAGRTGGGWLHDAARADTAAHDAQILGGLADAASASKLRERDPDAFKQFVAQAAEDGPVPAVYIDGRQLAEALHQSGVGMDELTAKMPRMAEQLPEAMSTGGLVRIPVEDFATHIAGGKLEQPLMDHLRVDPEGMTLGESKAFFQSHQEELTAAGLRAADQRAADEPMVQSRRQVFESVKAQLADTGRFPDGVNDAYAALHGSFYATMAERAGMLPHELLERYPVHIAAESPARESLSAPGQRGAFDPSTKTIAILKGADLSTFLHESGHSFLDTLSHIAAQPDAPEGIRADMQALLRSFKVPDLDTWHSMSLDEQRANHEQFARGFERYLMEGKSPDLEMRSLFQRFRAWLTHVYKSLSVLKADLTPEVRGVFDRMLASADAIKAAETARRYMPLFETPEKASMTPEEWSKYQALGTDATDQAIEALTSKTVRDMAYLSRTRAEALKAVSKDAAEKRKVITREVRSEVMSQPIYRAWDFLTKRGEPVKAGEIKVNEEVTGQTGKLRTSAVKAIDEGALPLLDARHMVREKDGLHPDIVAEIFGFDSGDQLLKALQVADDPKHVIEGLTDQRMLERHGELPPRKRWHAPPTSWCTTRSARGSLRPSCAGLNKAIGPARDLAKAAKEVAEATIGSKRVRDINEGQFTRGNASAKDAEKRLAAGDTGRGRGEARPAAEHGSAAPRGTRSSTRRRRSST
jgi:hypothetical protein